jgi:hypothetical protein
MGIESFSDTVEHGETSSTEAAIGSADRSRAPSNSVWNTYGRTVWFGGPPERTLLPQLDGKLLLGSDLCLDGSRGIAGCWQGSREITKSDKDHATDLANRAEFHVGRLNYGGVRRSADAQQYPA